MGERTHTYQPSTVDRAIVSSPSETQKTGFSKVILALALALTMSTCALLKERCQEVTFIEGILKWRLGRKPHASRFMACEDCKHGLWSAVVESLTVQWRGRAKDRAKPSLFLNMGKGLQTKGSVPAEVEQESRGHLGRWKERAGIAHFFIAVFCGISTALATETIVAPLQNEMSGEAEVKKCSRQQVKSRQGHIQRPGFSADRWQGFFFFKIQSTKRYTRKKTTKQSGTHF